MVPDMEIEMKALAIFSLGVVTALLLKRLAVFILEPDYVPGYMDRNNAIRCDGILEELPLPKPFELWWNKKNNDRPL